MFNREQTKEEVITALTAENIRLRKAIVDMCKQKGSASLVTNKTSILTSVKGGFKMMKNKSWLVVVNLLCVLSFLLALGCKSSNTDQFQYVVVEIEGCEYIAYNTYRYKAKADPKVWAVTHKGNCKNPIHQHER